MIAMVISVGMFAKLLVSHSVTPSSQQKPLTSLAYLSSIDVIVLCVCMDDI